MPPSLKNVSLRHNITDAFSTQLDVSPWAEVDKTTKSPGSKTRIRHEKCSLWQVVLRKMLVLQMTKISSETCETSLSTIRALRGRSWINTNQKSRIARMIAFTIDRVQLLRFRDPQQVLRRNLPSHSSQILRIGQHTDRASIKLRRRQAEPCA
jgi:hypothetical protein